MSESEEFLDVGVVVTSLKEIKTERGFTVSLICGGDDVASLKGRGLQIAGVVQCVVSITSKAATACKWCLHTSSVGCLSTAINL